jgi:CBS domain-containing protein
MKTATKPMLDLTAGDLMTAPVMTIPQEMPIRDAARLFSGAHISGAPVVDAHGRCVGVLSSSDFVTWAAEGRNERGAGEKVTCFIAPWGEMIDIEEKPDTEISHYMTVRPITTSPRTSIGDLAQKMVDAHIHRILVVVEDDLPQGIVTTTDILAAISQAARNARNGGRYPGIDVSEF